MSDDLEKIADLVFKSSIWKPADVSQEPETKLIQWQVYKVMLPGLDEFTLHFNGYTAGYYGEGRVCSPVMEFDKNTMRGVTRSGRVYELVGSPGHNSDAAYVWNKWLSLNDVEKYECVTDQFWSE